MGCTVECTDCTLTQGFLKDCKQKVAGGNQTTIWLVPRCNIGCVIAISPLLTTTVNVNKVIDFGNDTVSSVTCAVHQTDLDTNGESAYVYFTGTEDVDWYKLSVNKDTLITTEDLTLPNGFITQTVTFAIPNLAVASPSVDAGDMAQRAANFARALTSLDGGVVAVIQDRAGVRRVFGLTNGLEASAASKTSGTAIADVSGNTITLVSGEPNYAPALTCDYNFAEATADYSND